jgi:signal transduction histidine kinase
MVLLIPVLNSKAILQAALTFSILYAWLPLLKTGEYPVYTVIINAVSFTMMAIVSGRLSDALKNDRDALQKTSDVFHRLTNTLNMQIMDLQSTVDSLNEAYVQSQESDRKRHFYIHVSHELRSPLSSIRSFSEILQTYEDIDAEPVRNFWI